MKSVKKIVSIVCAFVMTASVAVTAFAADYAQPVGPIAPTEPTTSTVSATEVKDLADNGTVAVNVSSSRLVIKPSTLKTLAAKDDAAIEFVSPKTTITIESDSVKKVARIDLSMKVTNSASRTRIKMKSNKEFGAEVKITVTSCKMSAKALAKAHVYCDGEDLGPVELDENGKPVITVTKGGVYEIK